MPSRFSCRIFFSKRNGKVIGSFAHFAKNLSYFSVSHRTHTEISRLKRPKPTPFHGVTLVARLLNYPVDSPKYTYCCEWSQNALNITWPHRWKKPLCTVYNLGSSHAFSLSLVFHPRKASVILIPRHSQASRWNWGSQQETGRMCPFISPRRLNFSGVFSGILIMMAAIVIIR